MVALPILLIVAAIRSICRGQERGLRKLLLYRLFSWNRQDKSEEFFHLLTLWTRWWCIPVFRFMGSFMAPLFKKALNSLWRKMNRLTCKFQESKEKQIGIVILSRSITYCTPTLEVPMACVIWTTSLPATGVASVRGTVAFEKHSVSQHGQWHGVQGIHVYQDHSGI